MIKPVTGTPSIVGFTNEDDHHNGHHGRASSIFSQNFVEREHHNHGMNAKDYMFQASLDGGERTRDVLNAIADTNRNVERQGSASVLATEKTAANTINFIDRNAFELRLQANEIAALNQKALCDLSAQLAECCCEIKESVADVKATILSLDANRIRDDLNRAQAELLAIKYHGSKS